jgi:hypothetical protein
MPVLCKEEQASNQPSTGAAFSLGFPGISPENVRPEFSDSRRIAAPETSVYGDMLARSHGRDDMSFWSMEGLIRAPESNGKQIFQNEVRSWDPSFARRPETPPPQFVFPEVLHRLPEGRPGKVKPGKSTPSSFETVQQNYDALDDADEEENGDQFHIGIRSMKGIHADEAIFKDIYHTYLDGLENAQSETGVTLMLRDIPYRLQVEPHLLDILRQTCNLEHVDYIYLPMTIEGFSTRLNVQTRNKGYCFIHFSVAATAQTFAARVPEYEVQDISGGKSMFTAPAKFQGLGTNLINLLDIGSKKWRPKNGLAHIRISTGELVCVGLLPLRNLVKRRSVRPNAWPGKNVGSQLRPFPGAQDYPRSY